MSLGSAAYGIALALPATDNPSADFSDTPWWLHDPSMKTRLNRRD